jgi:hypothetical protein
MICKEDILIQILHDIDFALKYSGAKEGWLLRQDINSVYQEWWTTGTSGSRKIY